MKKFFQTITITLFVFFVLYYPPIIRINVLHVLTVRSVVGIAGNIEARNVLKYFVGSSKLLYAIFIYSLLIFVSYSNIGGINGLFLQCFEMPFVLFYLHCVLLKKTKHSLGDIIIYASIAQAILAIIAFLVPSVQSFFILMFMKSGFNDIFEKMAEWRMYGFSYTLAYSMPIIQSIIASYCLYCGIKKRVIYLFAVPLIAISSFINARTGIVIFAIGMVTVFACTIISNDVKSLFNTIFATIILLIVPIIVGNFMSDSKTLDWLLEGTNDLNAFITGTNDYSEYSYFNYVADENVYRIPSDFFEAIFGTGFTTMRGNSAMTSDVGFINQIWSIGIVGMLLLLTFYIMNTKNMCKYYIRNGERHVFILGTILILLVSNVKGDAFSWNELTQLWFVVYTKFIYDQYKQIEKV